MMGVEATVMGFGFLGAGFVYAGTAGKPLMVISGSGFGSAGLSALSAFSGAAEAAFASAVFGSGLPFESGFWPRTSAVVAAIISRAGMTSPSSAGAGSRAGSGFLPRPALAWGTLKSRTVGS